ncbi:hypothetical protein TI05_04160 [Achromatium sp. WMS3]|nr:hypothetical protein TI05_04160 [Achromatium sp. WMS3]
MLQNRIIDEIRHIPDNKLPELYDLIHYFRLGLTYKQHTNVQEKQRPIGLAKQKFKVPDSFFDPLPNEILDAFEDK